MMRYTEKRKGKNVIPLRNAVCGVHLPHWSIHEQSEIQSFLSGDAVDRLAELEDKIERGTLIELKEPHIVKNEGSVCYEVWWQEVVNRFDWFDTKEEAEKRLKELQNG